VAGLDTAGLSWLDARALKLRRDFWLGLLGCLSFACQPEIGDSCTSSSDCSVSEQRTCDTTQPGGYCTRFSCTAGDCPEEAACIGFRSVLSSAPLCSGLQERPRLQRTACLRRCSKESDCRGGYDCIDMSLPNPWGASVIENSGGTKVCALPPPSESYGDTAICSPAPAPAPVPPLDAGRIPPLDASAPDAAADGGDSGVGP
jgi:hypothetical protein